MQTTTSLVDVLVYRMNVLLKPAMLMILSDSQEVIYLFRRMDPLKRYVFMIK